MEFRKFSSIEQFRNAIKRVSDHAKYHNKPLPTLKFVGTVKLHGTNAGIGIDVVTGEMIYQSREHILGPGEDNAGFKGWACNSLSLTHKLGILKDTFKPKETMYVFGEWCGGSIQKGVALNQLGKMFVVFSVVVDGVEVDIRNVVFGTAQDVRCIYEFPSYEIEIDFNNPQAVQNKLVDLTVAVETECPVGRAFGVTGVGEGVVWHNLDTGIKFKVKGEKHSVSKVKTLRELAPTEVALINSTKEFIATVVTENRLNQGLEQFGGEKDIKNLGAFIKWVANDVFKEESDTIDKNGFNRKVIGSEIAAAARAFFLN